MISDYFIKNFVYLVLIIGIVAYLFIMGAYLSGKIWGVGQWAVDLLDRGGSVYTFGLPIAGVVATAIVYVFGIAAGRTGNDTGKYESLLQKY